MNVVKFFSFIVWLDIQGNRLKVDLSVKRGLGGDDGLAGAQIRIDGLKQTTTDALVRIRLSDGSVYRVVLRPTETTTTIPNPHKTKNELKKSHTSLLQFIDHWRYGLLLSTAFVLSLLPSARRRGIVLCTVALIAVALYP